MPPFLQDKVAARKLLIYSSDRDGEHPMNAAELTDKTGKTLDGGPITVYDGGAYAGEALLETLKTGDRRLVGYAVDYGTRVDSTFGRRDQTIREIHARNGNLQLRYSRHQTRISTARNVDSKAKTLIVEQPRGRLVFFFSAEEISVWDGLSTVSCAYGQRIQMRYSVLVVLRKNHIRSSYGGIPPIVCLRKTPHRLPPRPHGIPAQKSGPFGDLQ